MNKIQAIVKNQFNNILFRIRKYEQKRPNVHLLSYPTTLLVETTSRCNLDCIMCFRHNNPSYPIGDMDETTFKQLISAFPHIKHVNLQARGEPLVHQLLLSWIKLAKQAGCHVSFFTNGLLLTEPVYRELVSLPLDQLTISLDAASKPRFENIRKRADFERIIRNVKDLVEYKHNKQSQFPELNIHFVAMRQNINELLDVIKLAKGFEASAVIVEHLWVYDLAMIEETLFLEPERMRTYFSLAEELAQELKINLILPSEEPIKFCEPQVFEEAKKKVPKLQTLTFPTSVPSTTSKQICLEPWQIAIVYWNGDVMPCCYTSRIMGNLRTQNFKEIWNNQTYRNFRKAIRTGVLPAECINCRKLQNRILK